MCTAISIFTKIVSRLYPRVTKPSGAPCRAFTILLFAALAVLFLVPREAGAQTHCGGLNERACCVLERNGPACDGGLVERSGCSGDCRCAHSLVNSSGTCRLSDIQPCGGEGQRACCAFEGAGGACNSGLEERGGCAGDCRCGNNLLSSSGTCRRSPPPPVITPCGGDGQRACCALERAGGACNSGLEVIRADDIGDRFTVAIGHRNGELPVP